MIQLLKKLSWKQSRSCFTFGGKNKNRHLLTGQSIRDVTYKEPWCSLNRSTTTVVPGGIMLRLQRPSFGPWRNTAFSEWKAFENSRRFFFWWKFVPEGWSVFFFWGVCWFLSRCCFVVLKDFSRLLGFRATNLGTHVSGAKSIALALERVGEKRCTAVFLQTWVMQIHHATDRSLATLKKAPEITHNITNNITKPHFFPHFLLAFFVEIRLFLQVICVFFTQIYFDQTDSVEQQEVLPMMWLRLSGQEWRASFSCMGFYKKYEPTLRF